MERRIPIWVAVCTIFPCASDAQTNATLETQARALTIIGDAAERICNSVSVSGGSRTVELSGKAKAEIAGVIKNVAELGVEGAGKYQSTEYNNVLQQDLARVIQQNTNCKQAVFNKLVDQILPKNPPPISPPPQVNSTNSVKQALGNAGAIVVDVKVPRPGGSDDQRFLKEVGQTVTVMTKNYDPRSGRGEIEKLSFGYGGGQVVATDATLTIANSSPQGCSGSFRLAEPGLLRGRLNCRWGNPYPSYEATINLGP